MIPSNPFSSCFLGPDAMRYQTSPAELERMLARVEAGGRLAIVGPHGTGKTTLLHTLRRALRARGYATRTISLHDGGTRRRQSRAHGTRGEVLFVDGYEQLSRPRRWMIGRSAHALVVTSHDPALTVLARTSVSPELAAQLVATLLRPFPQSAVRPHDVIQALARHQGNMREALFVLYDRHEAQRGLKSRCGSAIRES